MRAVMESHDLTIELSILSKLCPSLLQVFCLILKKKWGMKKENRHSVLRGYGEGEGGVKGVERVVVD